MRGLDILDKLDTPGAEQREPEPADSARHLLRAFFASVTAAAQSLLLLDFDGTLAPFRKDPATSRPWAGVPALLDAIRETGKTRLVFISGRPAQDVSRLIALREPVEVWGLHGAERLLPNGSIEAETLAPHRQTLLHAARAALEESAAEPGSSALRVEIKWNGVAAHWRGLQGAAASVAEANAQTALLPFARTGELELLRFDGGIELRAGRHKGDAVRHLLAESAPGAPAAYLGDDLTDEHAFKAIAGAKLGSAGLSILVRREPRPSAASVWLKPPQELRAFLRQWLRAAQS